MKTFQGKVVSAKLQKTATVEVRRSKNFPMYHKEIFVKRNYLVHNVIGAEEGDEVIFVETRPISKNKHWNITKILRKNKKLQKEKIEKETPVVKTEKIRKTVKETGRKTKK